MDLLWPRANQWIWADKWHSLITSHITFAVCVTSSITFAVCVSTVCHSHVNCFHLSHWQTTITALPQQSVLDGKWHKNGGPPPHISIEMPQFRHLFCQCCCRQDEERHAFLECLVEIGLHDEDFFGLVNPKNLLQQSMHGPSSPTDCWWCKMRGGQSCTTMQTKTSPLVQTVCVLPKHWIC